MVDTKNLTILAVDDDDGLREAIVYDFKKAGFKTLEASDGREAFEILSSNKVDLVVTDVRMPNGDGIELLARIRQKSPDFPIVIFVTGFSQLSLEDAYDKGADAVFAKPFNRKALIEAVIKAAARQDDKWNKRRQHDRAESELLVKLNYVDLGQALQSKVLNISRGGIFVSLNHSLPTVGQKIEFTLIFDQGMPIRIIGRGVVRWIRTEDDPEKPAGFGIEFDFLSDQSRRDVVVLINSIKTKSFMTSS
jgi:CheY-like chemotaxis protein